MKKINKFILSTVALVLGITGCTQKSSTYRIEGTLHGSSLNGEYLYLYSYDDRENVDSTIVDGQNFVFTGKREKPVLVRIEGDDRQTYANLILESGEVKVDFDKHLGSPTTPLNKEFVDYITAVEEFNKSGYEKFEKLQEEYPDPMEREKKAEEVFEEFNKSFKTLITSYFIKNKDNIIGAQALTEYAHSASPEEVDELIAMAGPVVLETESVKDMITRNDATRKTAEGMPFVDFTVETEDGQTISLSDYVGKGKYVLVDFWASWCGPCIQETPVIAEVYEKYKDKGLEVLGIAVWDQPEATKGAIEKHNITWPQILNAQTIPTDAYGIAGIPHIILFGPDGKIVKRNLRGDGLKKTVAEAIEGK